MKAVLASVVKGGAEHSRHVQVPDLPLAVLLTEADGVSAPAPVGLGHVASFERGRLVSGGDPDSLGGLTVTGNFDCRGGDCVFDQQALGARREGVLLDVRLLDGLEARPGTDVFSLEDDSVLGALKFVNFKIVTTGQVVVCSAAHDVNFVYVLDALYAQE